MNVGADGAENGGGKHVILDVERIRRDEVRRADGEQQRVVLLRIRERETGADSGAEGRHEHIVHQHEKHQYRRSAHEVDIDFRRLSEPRLAAHACPTDDTAEQRTQHRRAERNQQRHLQTVQNHPVALLRYQVVGETVCYAGDEGVGTTITEHHTISLMRKPRVVGSSYHNCLIGKSK